MEWNVEPKTFPLIQCFWGAGILIYKAYGCFESPLKARPGSDAGQFGLPRQFNLSYG